MKKCPNCGTQLNDDVLFCTECGNQIPQSNVCPHCGASVNKGDAFCQNCGKKVDEVPASIPEESVQKKCPRCGAPVNDGNAFCENCGMNLAEMIHPQLSNRSNIDSKELLIKLKKLVPFVVGLILLAAIIWGSIYGYEEYSAYRAKKEAREKFVADSLEQARKDSIKLAEQKEIARKDSLEKARIQLIQQPYLALLDKYDSQDDNWGKLYFLFDITGDGLPEIWMNIIEGENFKFCVYSCQNGNAKLLFKDELGFNNSFHQGDNYILMEYAHMGYQVINKFVLYKGIIKRKKIYESETEEDTSMDEVEYKEIKEPLITTYEISDKNPIYEIK